MPRLVTPCSCSLTEHMLLVLITGFESPPGLPWVKGLIAAYIWRNRSLSNLHPHRIYNFCILSSGLDSNADDWFIVWDLTDWANENQNHPGKKWLSIDAQHFDTLFVKMYFECQSEGYFVVLRSDLKLTKVFIQNLHWKSRLRHHEWYCENLSWERENGHHFC